MLLTHYARHLKVLTVIGKYCTVTKDNLRMAEHPAYR